MDIGGSSPKSVPDGSSWSAQDLVPAPAIPPQEEQPTPEVAPVAVSLVATLMHDVITSLNVTLVPASELPVAELIAATTSGVVAAFVAPEPEAETGAAEATTSGIVATFVAPEPEVEAEAAGVLQVLACIPPSEAGPSTGHAMASILSSEAGPSTSRALVPVGASIAEGHDEPWNPSEAFLEEIQLLDDPLLDVEMEATIMEMYHHVGKYAAVSFLLLRP